MKKLIRRRARFNGLTLGLDLHKQFIEWCVLDRQGDEKCGGRVDSTRAALEKLTAKLSHEPLQVSMEACGCFVWVFDFFKERLGAEAVHVAQPSRVHVIANSMEKNDANDAWWLAYLLYEGRLPESHVVEGVMRDLRIATRELRAYTDERSDLLRRIKSHLAQAGISISKNWHASRKGREQANKEIAEVKGERQGALRCLLKKVKQLTRTQALWRERIAALSAGLPLVQTLSEEFPGFGIQLSSVVVAELNEPQKYHSAKAYAKATGLVPGSRESGGKNQVVGISRAGSRHARWAFTRAVISCMRCKRGVGAQIRQWVTERTCYKHKRKVIVAAARKLAESVWRLLALGEVFDLQRAFPVKTAVTG